mmetsp:Transcript_34704/g.88312  ORF Transcript_34704/g.88312 Transcript_34704/m.88312 type:complete len:106 (+) Transcript_34704:197-514(+)
MDASGATVASVAKTGEKVDGLRAWLAEMRSSCGCCGKKLASPGAPPGGGEPVASACGQCKQVRYCGRACQQADWKDRHKACCLKASDSLAGDMAWQMLIGPTDSR